MKGTTRLFILLFIVGLILNIPSLKHFVSYLLKATIYVPILTAESEWEEFLMVREERDQLLLKLHSMEEKRWSERDSLLTAKWMGTDTLFKFARAIAFDPMGIPTRIVLDLGKDAGVEYGQTVLYHGVLVGKIHSVEKNASEAITIFNPEFKIAVADMRSGVLGVLKGGNRIFLDYIPENADVRKGDTLVTAGVSDTHPPGILVGTIESIRKERKNPLFLTVEVKPFFNYTMGAIFAIR